MKLFDVLGGTARVFLKTRGEHCPPHVHVAHRGEGWEAKIRFSYVDDAVTVIEVYPARGRPTTTTLNTVVAEIQAQLNDFRAKWLTIVPDLDLDNKWFQISSGKAKQLARKAKGAKQVQKATYDTDKQVVKLWLKDGSDYEFDAGKGEVE